MKRKISFIPIIFITFIILFSLSGCSILDDTLGQFLNNRDIEHQETYQKIEEVYNRNQEEINQLVDAYEVTPRYVYEKYYGRGELSWDNEYKERIRKVWDDDGVQMTSKEKEKLGNLCAYVFMVYGDDFKFTIEYANIGTKNSYKNYGSKDKDLMRIRLANGYSAKVIRDDQSNDKLIKKDSLSKYFYYEDSISSALLLGDMLEESIINAAKTSGKNINKNDFETDGFCGIGFRISTYITGVPTSVEQLNSYIGDSDKNEVLVSFNDENTKTSELQDILDEASNITKEKGLTMKLKASNENSLYSIDVTEGDQGLLERLFNW